MLGQSHIMPLLGLPWIPWGGRGLEAVVVDTEEWPLDADGNETAKDGRSEEVKGEEVRVDAKDNKTLKNVRGGALGSTVRTWPPSSTMGGGGPIHTSVINFVSEGGVAVSERVELALSEEVKEEIVEKEEEPEMVLRDLQA